MHISVFISAKKTFLWPIIECTPCTAREIWSSVRIANWWLAKNMKMHIDWNFTAWENVISVKSVSKLSSYPNTRKRYAPKGNWFASFATSPKWPWKCLITKITAVRERNDAIGAPTGFSYANGIAIKIAITPTCKGDSASVRSLLKLKRLLITMPPKFKVRSLITILCYLVNFVTDSFRWGNCLSIRYVMDKKPRFFWNLSHSGSPFVCQKHKSASKKKWENENTFQRTLPFISREKREKFHTFYFFDFSDWIWKLFFIYQESQNRPWKSYLRPSHLIDLFWQAACVNPTNVRRNDNSPSPNVSCTSSFRKSEKPKIHVAPKKLSCAEQMALESPMPSPQMTKKSNGEANCSQRKISAPANLENCQSKVKSYIEKVLDSAH